MAPRIRENPRLALFEDHNFIFDACRPRFAGEQLQGFFHRFMRQPERPIVHRDHPVGIQVPERLHRIPGTGMNIAKCRRRICANGQQCNLGLEPAPNLMKSFEVGCVW